MSKEQAMNRRQRLKVGRCRDCGVGGGQPHADECGWIGGVCEYQLVPPPDGEGLEMGRNHLLVKCMEWLVERYPDSTGEDALALREFVEAKP